MKIALFVAAALAAACGSQFLSPASVSPSAPPSVSPSPIGTQEQTSSPPPSPTASPTPAASDTPSEAPDEADRPPDALLSTGPQVVTGWLGPYCWHSSTSACLDGPMVPKADLPLVTLSTRTSDITLSLSDGAHFIYWSAAYAATANKTWIEIGQGGAEYDPDLTATPPPELDQVHFGSPPVGDWIVRVRLQFLNGEASYAWHAIVP